MKTRATHQETIAVGPLSEDTGHEILRFLKDTYQWMPLLSCDVRLDRIELVLSRERGSARVDKASQPLVPPMTGGEHLFGTQYKLVLQGLTVAQNADLAQMAGQLTVRNSEGTLLLSVPLSLYRYLCVRALVERSLNAEGILQEESDLRLVSLAGREFEDVFSEYGEECGRSDVGDKDAKDIADFIRLINIDFTEGELPKLIAGTARRGFRLDTHPANIRFILPPNNPFDEAGQFRRGYGENAKPLRGD